MRLNITIDLNLKTGEALEKCEKAAREAMRDTVIDVQSEAIHSHPYKDRTGTNTRSITAEASGFGGNKVVDPSKIQGAVYTESGYGGYLETGSRPHTITVKKAKVLTDGENFFGTTVHHPGTNPYPYIKPAFDKKGKDFPQRMKKHLAGMT